LKDPDIGLTTLDIGKSSSENNSSAKVIDSSYVNLVQPILVFALFCNIDESYFFVDLVSIKHVFRLKKYHDRSACIKSNLGVKALVLYLIEVTHQDCYVEFDITFNELQGI
jgi:hypothetical protein